MSTYEYRKDAHEGYYDPETGIEYYEDGTKRG